jgi:hypothetical protein
MIRIVATVSLAILAECTPALCADLADGPYLGGKDKLFKKSPDGSRRSLHDGFTPCWKPIESHGQRP